MSRASAQPVQRVASDRKLVPIAALLALITLTVSLYLTLQSLQGAGAAGCGAGSGCGEVLGSRWAKIGPLPVSLLGAGVYFLVLLGLGMRWGSRGYNRVGDTLLWLATPVLMIAALWFTTLQVFAVGAFCPYCMAAHAGGFCLSIVLGVMVAKATIIRPKPALLLGMLAGITLIPVQLAFPASDPGPQRVPNPFVEQDGDATIDDFRYLSVFGGELQFVLQDVGYIGKPDAEQVVAVIFDYACPHCRSLHKLLDKAVTADPERLVVVPVPVTIDERHNPHAQSEQPRFDDSFDRALLSMAIAQIDLDKWREFDAWLFAFDDEDAFPRSAADARAKAEELVGVAVLSGQLTNDNLNRLTEQLKRHIDLLALVPDDSRFIPITTTPGAPGILTQDFKKVDALYELLDAAKANRQTEPGD